MTVPIDGNGTLMFRGVGTHNFNSAGTIAAPISHDQTVEVGSGMNLSLTDARDFHGLLDFELTAGGPSGPSPCVG